MMAVEIAIAALALISPEAANSGSPDRSWRAGVRKPAAGAPVAGLPHAGGRRFATLDAYLAYLRDYLGPIDRPWYREVRPGVYRLETGNLRGRAPPREFTRDELERKFGFRK